MQIQAIVDRFEGNKVVMLVGDNEVQIVWPLDILPEKVQEGDILQFAVQIDRVATIAAKAEAENLLKQIVNNNQED